jgi:hypothetical protein
MESAGRRDGDPYRNSKTTAVGDGVSPSRRKTNKFTAGGGTPPLQSKYLHKNVRAAFRRPQK